MKRQRIRQFVDGMFPRIPRQLVGTQAFHKNVRLTLGDGQKSATETGVNKDGTGGSGGGGAIRWNRGKPKTKFL